MEIFKNSVGRYEVTGAPKDAYQKNGKSVPGIGTYSKFWGPVATRLGFAIKCKDVNKNTCYLVKSSASAYLFRHKPTQSPPVKSDAILKELSTLAVSSVSTGKKKTKFQKTPSVKIKEKKKSIDFAKITPANYEQYVNVHQMFDIDSQNVGDFIFMKRVHERDFSSSNLVYTCKAGEVYLTGFIAHVTRGCFGGGGLEIRDGKFIHYPQMNTPAQEFSNLKDFFDYLFKGLFYQGECTKNLKFFTLHTVDGQKVRYYNPYNS